MREKAKRWVRLALVCGLLGCLCFGAEDRPLGYVDPVPVSETIFSFIRAGHGVKYDAWKIVVTLVMGMSGMCFMIPGMAGIAAVAKKAKPKRLLRDEIKAAGWKMSFSSAWTAYPALKKGPDPSSRMSSYSAASFT